MKKLFLLCCVSTCFSFEAPALKRTPLAKEKMALLIQPNVKHKSSCGDLWDKYKETRRKAGFLSASADKLWHDFMACSERYASVREAAVEAWEENSAN